MKALTKYSIENLRKNQKRTIMTVLGVALSCALIFIMASIAASFHYGLINYSIEIYGDYHDMYENVPGDKLSILENSEFVKVQFYANPITTDNLDSDDKWLLDYSRGPYPAEYIERIDEVTDRSADRMYNVFVKYTNFKNVGNVSANLVRALGKKVTIRKNSMLRELYGDLSETYLLIIRSFAIVIFGVVLIASVFVIRNSFNISVTERVRQFGMLASIGARPRQIRRVVYLEAAAISLIALPLSILIGAAVTFGLVTALNILIGPFLEFRVRTVLPPYAMLVVLVFGVLLVLFASLSAAIYASAQSPISAIRGNKDITDKRKKYKSATVSGSFWGISGVLASRNLQRSRKRYRTTVISIVVSVAMFVGFSSIISYVDTLLDIAYPEKDITLSASSSNPKILQEVYDNMSYNDAALSYSLAGVIVGARADSPRFLYVRLYSSDYFKRYAESQGFSSSHADDVVIFADSYKEGTQYYRHTDYEEGEYMRLEFGGWYYDEDGNVVDSEKTVDFQIYRITDKRPLGASMDSGVGIYVSENNPLFKDVWEELYHGETAPSHSLYVDASYDDSAAIEDYINSVIANDYDYLYSTYVYNASKEVRIIRNLVTLVSIFAYSFIAIVALVGATNTFNAITTNLEMRAKEFAMLKSVGMTTKEFDGMVRLEGVIYTSRALIIGIPIGLLISYAFNAILAGGGIEIGFKIPYVSVAIAVFGVLLLVLGIMSYSVRRVRQQNIIETIRNDNI